MQPPSAADREQIQHLLSNIHREATRPLRLMEVCGGHTVAIHQYGIPSLLPPTITLLSGPGCPVCVTSRTYIDQLSALAGQPDVILTTFGDLMRVPGSQASLLQTRAAGADIRLVYSIRDALALARNEPRRRVVFAAIGFETTAPGTAAGILEARQSRIHNFYVLSAHKLMPPALQALVDLRVPIDGYLAPGHVSTITGSRIYHDLAVRQGKAVVVTGFEALDLLQAILMLVRQINRRTPTVDIQYRQAVSEQGNLKAQAIMAQVFQPVDAWWRGLGILPASGLGLRPAYHAWDAAQFLPHPFPEAADPAGCRCGDVLRGLLAPSECRFFGSACTPANPIGACMVSEEGACRTWYRHEPF